MTILASPQTATVNITAPGAYITVSCAQGDVMQVDWVSPGNVMGTRFVRLPSVDVGPFVDDTVVTLRAITGAPDYVLVQGAGGGGGSGTVSSVNITAPAAGITASGGPVTTSGAITLALADDLAAVEAIAAIGIVRRTAANTWSAGTAVDLAAEVTGTLPVASGGTGATTSTGTGAVVLATAPSVTNLTTNRLILAGNISAPAWTTSGLRISGVAATLTDTTSAGTVAAASPTRWVATRLPQAARRRSPITTRRISKTR